jgi:predicted nucleic acid-binding protein
VIAYLDTSAALRVLTISPNPDAARLTRRTQRYLDQLVEKEHTIVSSMLLRTEMRCQANRQPDINPGDAEQLLSLVNLVALEASDLEDAPGTPGRLRTLDAIHLAAALRIGADVIVAYDDELRRAAKAAGLRIGPSLRPG